MTDLIVTKTPCKGGIYGIRLVTDGRIYVGQTIQEFKSRWKDHLSHLENSTE
ncbi:MAG: GIY-YIG nuclease family protein [Brasilonema sp.]